jgi:hypothetical protein
VAAMLTDVDRRRFFWKFKFGAEINAALCLAGFISHNGCQAESVQCAANKPRKAQRMFFLIEI